MRKQLKNIYWILFSALTVAGCHKPRNFYEDSNDPGLSRLTSRGYNIATCYINNEAYINPYRNYLFGGANTSLTIEKIQTAAAKDTLRLTWQIERANAVYSPGSPLSYTSMNLFIPINKNFSTKDFEALAGTRFPYDTSTNISMKLDNLFDTTLTDSTSIYFVRTAPDKTITSQTGFSFSGLFQGKIGPDIYITKGRFDFSITEDYLNQILR
ncbi:MAG: hypothetical protein QM764_06880 [Chitinophagaceae bacterium]